MKKEPLNVNIINIIKENNVWWFSTPEQVSNVLDSIKHPKWEEK